MFTKLKNWLFGIKYNNEATKIESTVVLPSEEPTESEPKVKTVKVRMKLRKKGRGGRKPHNFKLG